MFKPEALIVMLTRALPPEASARDELIALGMIATEIICQAPVEDRSYLVETFCNLLRRGVSIELN